MTAAGVWVKEMAPPPVTAWFSEIFEAIRARLADPPLKAIAPPNPETAKRHKNEGKNKKQRTRLIQ